MRLTHISVLLLQATLSFARTNDTAQSWHWEGMYIAQLAGAFTMGTANKPQQTLQAYTMFPVVNRDSIYLGLGIDYEAWHFPGDDARLLHRLLIPVGVYYEFSDRCYLYTEADAGIQSDFYAITSSDANALVYSYLCVLTKRKVKLRIGACYDYDLGASWIYPVFGCNWRSPHHFALDMFLPSHLMLRWRTGRRTDIGLKCKSLGRSFASGGQVRRIWKVGIGPYVDIVLIKNLILQCEISAFTYHLDQNFVGGKTGTPVSETTNYDQYGRVSLRLSY